MYRPQLFDTTKVLLNSFDRKVLVIVKVHPSLSSLALFDLRQEYA